MANQYLTPTEGHTHLSGLFTSYAEAQRAVNRLEALGVPRSDISVIYQDPAGDSNAAGSSTVITTDGGTRAIEGAGTGSAIGGTLGAILGAVAATASTIVMPGIGILIAGPIAGALAGAGAGGLTGGLIGALSGAGIPEEEARVYESGIRQGGMLVVADVPNSLEVLSRGVFQKPA